ncbi:hypothetical protein [Rhizobium ruizarguesonis]|uniref:hypothetical protein n=1 Tax=Rhizobium ruizarguesonis TaxID=2081791 RepID=UPI001FE193F2|nr:hypothetical protein [Rhizobium ruizarguesonis]
MHKAARSIIQAVTQREKTVSKWTALPGANRFRGMVERFRTWFVIIGLMLFSPLPVIVPFVWLAQGKVHGKQSGVLKAGEQPALFYLIVLFFFCDGLIWAHLCLTAAFRRFRLMSRR